MTGKVVVVGSSNIDLIMKMERLPRPGETVTEAEFAQVFGGKGANQAVGAARAGGKVAFVSCVGDDAYGGQVIENLKRDGIDTRHVSQEEGVATGTALIMIDAGGENCISVAPGANYRLTVATDPPSTKRGSIRILVGRYSAGCMICQRSWSTARRPMASAWISIVVRCGSRPATNGFS